MKWLLCSEQQISIFLKQLLLKFVIWAVNYSPFEVIFTARRIKHFLLNQLPMTRKPPEQVTSLWLRYSVQENWNELIYWTNGIIYSTWNFMLPCSGMIGYIAFSFIVDDGNNDLISQISGYSHRKSKSDVVPQTILDWNKKYVTLETKE